MNIRTLTLLIGLLFALSLISACGPTRSDDDDDAAPRPKKAEEDDDEVEVVVGGSLLLMGFGWWFGGISLVSLTLCLRRAIVTRGRSLDPRRLGRKEKADDLPI